MNGEDDALKLFTFYKNGETRLGVRHEGKLLDVTKINDFIGKHQFSTDIMSLIRSGEDALQSFLSYIQQLDYTDDRILLREDDISWAPAVTNPSKIICVGLNYKKHADETKSPYPEVPILFNKFSNALTGHLSEVTIPSTTERLDYEVELGIVIGKEGKHIKEEEALDYVFGYCTTNDLSA